MLGCPLRLRITSTSFDEIKKEKRRSDSRRELRETDVREVRINRKNVDTFPSKISYK